MIDFKRRRYVAAMIRAIDLAADRTHLSMYVFKQTRSAGLRTIRDFERVNRIAFDPFNRAHGNEVSGMARFGECVRALIRSKRGTSNG